MKLTTATALLALSCSSTVAVLAQDVQSKPFHLVLTNTSKKYNASTLGPCHEGAGIEALCLGPKHDTSTSSLFQFNTTKGETASLPKAGKTGVLTYELRGGNFNESQPLSFLYDPSTNVALPLFEPTDTYQAVAFDDENLMNVQSSLVDTTSPPSTETSHAYYRWFVCLYDFEAYTYTTLNWVAGRAGPQNPSCVRTDVKRVFA